MKGRKKMPIYPEIGKRLEELRESRGIHSQKALSEIIDVCERSYGDYERGKLPPTEVLIKLSDYYKVSVDYLLCKTNDKFHGMKDFHELTGLSEKAIETIYKINNIDLFYIPGNDPQKGTILVEALSLIIEHKKLLSFLYRLIESIPGDLKPIKEYQDQRKRSVEEAVNILSDFGYSVIAPGEKNTISLYNAKQEIGEIIDDLFRIKQSENIELRN